MSELTENEMDSCWYCQNCDKPMRDEESGPVDARKVMHCSSECVESYENEWYVD